MFAGMLTDLAESMFEKMIVSRCRILKETSTKLHESAKNLINKYKLESCESSKRKKTKRRRGKNPRDGKKPSKKQKKVVSVKAEKKCKVVIDLISDDEGKEEATGVDGNNTEKKAKAEAVGSIGDPFDLRS